MERSYEISQSARATSAIQQSFAWMFGGLLITAMCAVAAASDVGLQRALIENRLLFYGLLIAEFGLVVFISAGIARMTYGVAIGAFVAYAALNGVTLSLIFAIFTGASIAGAFLSASLVFGTMALYGFATKKDLSSLGSICMMILIGVIIAMVINLFLQSGTMSLLLSCAAVVIFAGLTAYDTQKIKMLSTQMDGKNLGIYGALTLYLDFINIFINLLRIFGQGRNN